MVRKLLIATKNRGKFKECCEILKQFPFQFLTLTDLERKIFKPISLKETGKTFRENAILKARTYGRLTGLLTLADDSGLVVACLNGRPGVESHRYHSGSDRERYLKLLREMKNVPGEKRGAKFVSAIVLFNPITDAIKNTSGECQGRIAFKPKGIHGFGFDPVFVVKELNKHFAELTIEEKNRVSHRARALQKMRKYLIKSSYEN